MQNAIELVQSRFLQDKYAKMFGIVLDELTGNSIRMHMQLTNDMLNWFNLPHGAAIYSLADAAFSVLANSKNNIAVALDCSITYHASPGHEAYLTVDGEFIANTEKTSLLLFKVYSETADARTLVATMKGIAYKTGRPIDPSVLPG